MAEYEGPKFSQSEINQIISEKLKKPDFKVLNYQQIAFEEIHGYLGDHSTLEVTIQHKNLTETHSFFVKTAPKTPSQRKFLEEINGYVKEKVFFKKYYPMLKHHGIDVLDGAIPECYLVTKDTFIFDNLKTLGYVTLPSRTPLPIDCIKAALVAFAKLHASGLILEETKSFRLTDEFGEELLKDSFYSGKGTSEAGLVASKDGMRALIDSTYTKISKETFKAQAVHGIELQKVFASPSSRFRNTICHADPWTKNFLFKFEDGKAINCVAVDWQTYRYGPPAQDVLSFIYLVADEKVREGFFDELLVFYYGKLKTCIDRFGFQNVITEKEFFESCRYFKQFALTQSLTHFQVVILADEDAKELFNDPEKARRVIFGDMRYDFVRKIVEKDPVYKKRVSAHIEELGKFYEGQSKSNNKDN